MTLRQKLIESIRKELPKLKINSAEFITLGWDYNVLVINKKVIFRFIKGKRLAKDFKREIKFLKKFSKISNLPIPKYFFVSKNKSFGAYFRIPGIGFKEKIYNSMSEKEKREAARKLGKFLSLLHSFSAPKAKSMGIERLDILNSWRDNRKKTRRYIFPMLSQKERDYITSFWKKYEKLLVEVKP